jgi:hypothetical protein
MDVEERNVRVGVERGADQSPEARQRTLLLLGAFIIVVGNEVFVVAPSRQQRPDNRAFGWR